MVATVVDLWFIRKVDCIAYAGSATRGLLVNVVLSIEFKFYTSVSRVQPTTAHTYSYPISRLDITDGENLKSGMSKVSAISAREMTAL